MSPQDGRDASDEADRQAVRSVLEGNRNAFSEIVRRHHRRLFRLAWRLLGDSSLAEEATQEALARAYTSLGRFRGDSAFRSWLIRILVNLCRDVGKSAPMREKASADPTAGGVLLSVNATEERSFDEGVDRRRVLAALEKAILALPEGQKEALIMRLIENESYEKISEVLGIPVGAVKVRVHRARQRLKEALGPMLDGILPREAA